MSNVYLLMAEEMGLIGLSVFLLIIGLFYDQARRAWPHMPEEYPSTAAGLGQRASAVIDLSAMLLGLSASIAGILVGGLLDHYFFNLSFPHSVSIFWLYLGLTMVVIRFGTTGTNSPRPALGRAAERGQPAGACPLRRKRRSLAGSQREPDMLAARERIWYNVRCVRPGSG